MAKFSRSTQDSASDAQAAPTYEAPSIIEYGSLRDVTLAVASTSTVADGGTGLTNKTR